jgi:hypothetical protein
MRKAGILWLLFLSNLHFILGQTLFEQGDVLVVGSNANANCAPFNYPSGDDLVSILFMVDLTPGSSFALTENGFNRLTEGLWGNSEGYTSFTYNGPTIPAGTAITFRFPSLYLVIDPPEYSDWTFTPLVHGGPGNLNIGTSGDQLFILQGGVWDNGVLGQHDATFTGLIAYAYNNKGAWVPFTNSAGDSGLPAALQPCYFYNTTGPVQAYSSYSGPMDPTTKENWAIRITNSANWTNFGNCGNYQLPPDFYEIIPFEWEDAPSTACAGGEGFSLPGSIAGVEGSWSGPGVTGNQFSPGNELGEVLLVFTPLSACHPNLEIAVEIEAGEALENPLDPTYCKEDLDISLPPFVDGIAGSWSGPGVEGNFFNPSNVSGGVANLIFTPESGDCLAILEVSLTLEDPTPVNLINFPSICNLSSSISLPNVQDGTTGEWSGEGVTGGNVFNPVGLSGLVELVFTPNPGQCRLPSSTTIEVVEAEIPILQSLPAEICSSEGPIALSPNQAGIVGVWSGPGVSGNFVWNPNGLSGTIALQFTPALGQCALLPDPVEIQVLESPIVTVESDVNPAVICPGESLVLTATGNSGGSPVFTWTLPGGAEVEGASIVVNQAGTYTVIANQGTCFSEPVSFEVEGSEPILIEALVTEPAHCGDNGGSVEVFASGGSGGLSIAWQGGQTDYFLEDLNPGSYSFTLTDGLGCSLEGSAEVLEGDQVPSLLVDLPESLCSNDPTAVLSFLFTEGQGPFEVIFSLNGQVQPPLTGNLSPLVTNLTLTEGTLLSVLEFSAGNCQGDVMPENAFIAWYQALESEDLIAACLGNQIEYFVTFQLIPFNPGSTYTILPSGSGSIDNNGLFTSNGIPLGTPYAFTLTELDSPCPPLVISGPAINNCGCLSQPGLMPLSLNELCLGDTLMITPLQEPQAPAPELALYYLHDNPGPTLGNVYAISTSPLAFFDPLVGMELGQTYYLSSVVGPNDGNGEIDLNDDCTLVSSGAPVRWTEPLAVEVSHSGFLCAGEDLLLTFEFQGNPPVSVTLQGDQQPPFTLTLEQSPATYTLEAGLFSDSILLLNVNPNACPGTWVGETFIPILSPLDTSQWTLECFETEQSYALSFELSGNAGSYVLIEGEGTLVDNIFTSDTLTYEQIFTLAIADSFGCDTLILSLEDLCALNDCQPGEPNFSLVEPNQSNCPGNILPVFLNLEKPDSLYTFSWQVPYPPFVLEDYPLNAQGGGNFGVVLTDTETGCTSDTLFFEIDLLDGPFVQNLIEECTGEENEYIVVFEIQGGDSSNYTINPLGSGFLDENIFTSNPLPGGTPYAFTLWRKGALAAR